MLERERCIFFPAKLARERHIIFYRWYIERRGSSIVRILLYASADTFLACSHNRWLSRTRDHRAETFILQSYFAILPFHLKSQAYVSFDENFWSSACNWRYIKYLTWRKWWEIKWFPRLNLARISSMFRIERQCYDPSRVLSASLSRAD